MKKPSKLLACCIAAACLLSVATTTRAQVLNPMQTAPEKQGRISLLFGLTAFVPGDESFGGGMFGVSYMPTPKSMFSAEIGGGIGPSNKIAEYSYTLSRNGSVFKTMNDGEVTYDYSFMQCLLTWNRMFDLSGRWQFRVGPTIGLLSISGGDKYSPTTYEGTEIEGLPKGKSEMKAAFTGGVVAGVRYNISERIFLDLNYLLSAHTAVGFERREVEVFDRDVTIAAKDFGHTGHRINLTLGWNLKKRNR
jgi:opacity protein-like surface antigen